jgi:hypothetical protein
MKKYLNTKIDVSILKITTGIQELVEFQIWYLNLKSVISIPWKFI